MVKVYGPEAKGKSNITVIIVIWDVTEDKTVEILFKHRHEVNKQTITDNLSHERQHSR